MAGQSVPFTVNEGSTHQQLMNFASLRSLSFAQDLEIYQSVATKDDEPANEIQRANRSD